MGFFDDVVNSVQDLGRNINREAINVGDRVNRSDLGRQVSQTWKDTGTGEIGGFYHNLANQAWGVYKNPVDAAQTGNWNKYGQQLLGDQVATYFGVKQQSQFVGNSPTAQNLLRDPNLNKNTLGLSKNYAGTMRGVQTLTNDGTLSNSDRNDAYQYWVKGVAAAAGAGAYSSIAAGAGEETAATAVVDTQEGGAVELAGDTYGDLVSESVTTEPLYLEDYGAVQVDSVPLEASPELEAVPSLDAGVGAAPGANAANAAGAGASYAQYLGYGAIGYGVLTGKSGSGSAFDLGGITTGDPQNADWMNQISDLLNSTNANSPNRRPSGGFSNIPVASDGTGSTAVGGTSILMLGALAVGGYFLAKKFKVI